jgi:hypothetical protein
MLYRLVHESRKRQRHYAFEFADAMYWTLRPATFESFQRLHGPRPIEYKDWFYSKLHQFLGIVVHEELEVYGIDPLGGPAKPVTDEPWKEGCGILHGKGRNVQPDEIEQSLVPEDNEDEEVSWFRLAWKLALASENRFEILRDWLRRMKERRSPSSAPRRGWNKNRERDQIVRNCLVRGMERRRICEELDRRTIATLPSMQQEEIFNWTVAWNHPNQRKRIQQLFSKLHSRQKAVKPLPVAG